MRDRAYGADVQDETCTRAFFERRRALEREDSHIRKVVAPPPSSAPPGMGRPGGGPGLPGSPMMGVP